MHVQEESDGITCMYAGRHSGLPIQGWSNPDRDTPSTVQREIDGGAGGLARGAGVACCM